MATLDRRAVAWLQQHHGTISAVEMDAAGITLDMRKHLVSSGVLTRVVDGGYRFGGSVDDELTRCAALCTSRPHLVVAGPTAARLWQLRRAPRDLLVHVIAPPRSHPCREPWVRAYRTATLTDEHTVSRPDGIRLTSPPRTVVDMTRYLDDVALVSLVEDSLARRLCTTSTLLRTAQELDTPGRPWARRFLRLLAQRAPGAPAESEWEQRVYAALARRRVPGMIRQLEVRLPGYGRARFDIAIPDLRWVLEIDVHPEHRTVEGAARDNRRDDAADAAGWFVRHVSEAQLSLHFESTMDAVVAAIERRREAVQ